MAKRRGGVGVATYNNFLYAVGGHDAPASNHCSRLSDFVERSVKAPLEETHKQEDFSQGGDEAGTTKRRHTHVPAFQNMSALYHNTQLKRS